MSLLSRLRDWVASLFGSEEATEPVADHACAVCGTAVEDPEEGCPLCGSLDVEPRGPGRSAADATPGTDPGDEPTADATPGPERRSVEGTTDDAVTRLRDVTADGPGDDGPDSTPDDADPSDDATDERADGADDG